MGGGVFRTHGFGKDVEDAYRAAIDSARCLNGHREGYSGDIQTTCGYTILKASRNPRKQEEEYLDTHGKEDPCAAVILKGAREKEYRERYGLKGKRGVMVYFFGWARS